MSKILKYLFYFKRQTYCHIHRIIRIHSIGWDIAITKKGSVFTKKRPVFTKGNDD